MKSQLIKPGVGKLALAAIIAASWLPSSLLAQDSDNVLEEVIVTAQKRVERLIDVPISISVFNTSAIQDQSISDLVDLGLKMPNVLAGGRFTAGISIRGISSNTSGPGFPPSVGVNLDGVFLGRARAFNTVMNDIERVEVLRGPQGTLYGKNTIAGTINVITRRPTNEFEASGDLTYGNFDLLQVRGSFGGPIVEDKVLFKVSALYKEREGYLYNETLGRDVNGIDEQGARAMLQFNPNDDLKIELFADFYTQDDESGVPETRSTFDGSILPFPPYTSVPPQMDSDRIVNLNFAAIRERDIWGTSAQVIYDMNGLELTSITAYREYDSIFHDDPDGSPLDLFDTGREENLDRFSQELRIASPADKAFSWIIGAYFDKEEQESNRAIRIGEHFPSAILGLPPLPPGFEELAQTVVNIDSESWALFASGNYDINEKLTLSGGVRYTDETKDLLYKQFPTKVIFGIVGLFALPIPLLEDQYSDEVFSGDVNLSYSFSPDQTGYIRYAHGFKAGGFQADTISPPPFTPPTSVDFDPETVDSFEVGYKGLFMDRRLSLSTAAFYYQYKDKQERINTGVSFVVSNAAEVSSYGAEIELSATPVDGLDIIASAGLLQAEYDLFPDGGGLGIDFTGNKLAGAPEVSGSLAVQYMTPQIDNLGGHRFYIRGELDHIGDYFFTAANNPLLKTEEVTFFNARIGLQGNDGKWGIYFWGKNLTDELVLGGGNSLFGNAILTRSINRGRTFGIELRGRM